MEGLFDTIGVDPLDISSLIFAWKLGAKVPFEFSRTEFVSGCAELGADSIEKLQAVIRKFCSFFVQCFPQHFSHLFLHIKSNS